MCEKFCTPIHVIVLKCQTQQKTYQHRQTVAVRCMGAASLRVFIMHVVDKRVEVYLQTSILVSIENIMLFWNITMWKNS